MYEFIIYNLVFLTLPMKPLEYEKENEWKQQTQGANKRDSKHWRIKKKVCVCVCSDVLIPMPLSLFPYL